jgi:2-polyprenyl-3-methyl-5-hydroxy-6-metoxy-1,4-benzoquinol methylase
MNVERCKICGRSGLSVFAHTATCSECGVLLYYPYPPGSHPNFCTEEEKRGWYGRSAFFNHSNFTRMVRYATTVERPLDPLSILDFGGGGGQFALVCRSHFPCSTVYLVDINDDSALEEWRPYSRRIRFAEFAADQTRFDLIFLNDVFEHLDDPVGELRRLAGKLTQGGKIFIDTPRQFWIYPVTRLISRKLYAKVIAGTVSRDHLQIWSEKAFQLAIQSSGLAVLKLCTWAEFTMPAEYYLDNMHITNSAVRALGHAMYRASALILRNKLACVLHRAPSAGPRNTAHERNGE